MWKWVMGGGGGSIEERGMVRGKRYVERVRCLLLITVERIPGISTWDLLDTLERFYTVPYSS